MLGIDGATNRLAKSISNVMILLPVPLFLEYLRVELKRETTVSAVSNITATINMLDEVVGIRLVLEFVSESCNSMRNVRRVIREKKKVK